jgi:hypothetical protein
VARVTAQAVGTVDEVATREDVVETVLDEVSCVDEASCIDEVESVKLTDDSAEVVEAVSGVLDDDELVKVSMLDDDELETWDADDEAELGTDDLIVGTRPLDDTLLQSPNPCWHDSAAQ